MSKRRIVEAAGGILYRTREGAPDGDIEVCVVPRPKAGGSFATQAWLAFGRPAAVERVRAHAGMDIGGTLIGMHLREVAVPVRLSLDRIGAALLLCARTRPRYIGGSRAAYE